MAADLAGLCRPRQYRADRRDRPYFGLHPLALEDVVNTGQRPKVDFFEDHAFVVLSHDRRRHARAATSRSRCSSARTSSSTFQERAGDPFNPVASHRGQRPQSAAGRKADYLAYALIDAIVDSYFPPVEAIGDRIDASRTRCSATRKSISCGICIELRRERHVLKGALWPMRDAFAALIRTEAPFARAETKIYLNDTLDHSLRLIETGRDPARHADRPDRDASVALPGAHQRGHLLPDDRLGDLHSADLPGRRLGHEFRPGIVALEHAGAEGPIWISAALLASWRLSLSRWSLYLPLEEVALTSGRIGHRR